MTQDPRAHAFPTASTCRESYQISRQPFADAIVRDAILAAYSVTRHQTLPTASKSAANNRAQELNSPVVEWLNKGLRRSPCSVEGMDLCLTGTAEIPLGGLYMDKVIEEADLPIRMA
eukprot:9475973-Pyramimonas_sp.AAC.2